MKIETKEVILINGLYVGISIEFSSLSYPEDKDEILYFIHEGIMDNQDSSDMECYLNYTDKETVIEWEVIKEKIISFPENQTSLFSHVVTKLKEGDYEYKYISPLNIKPCKKEHKTA